MKTADYAHRVRDLDLVQAKDIIIRCHKILDRAGVPDAAHAHCDDPECGYHLVHRVHDLVDRAPAVDAPTRDQLAIEAMKAICLKPGYANEGWPHNISVDAYAMADTMLQVRDSGTR